MSLAPHQRTFSFPAPSPLTGDKRRRSDHDYTSRSPVAIPPNLRRQSDMNYPNSGTRFDHTPGPPIGGLGSSYLSPLLSGPSKQNEGQVHSPIEHGHGTLVLTQSGSSRYLGPTAGTEWLKNVGHCPFDEPSRLHLMHSAARVERSRVKSLKPSSASFIDTARHAPRPVSRESLSILPPGKGAVFRGSIGTATLTR